MNVLDVFVLYSSQPHEVWYSSPTCPSSLRWESWTETPKPWVKIGIAWGMHPKTKHYSSLHPCFPSSRFIENYMVIACHSCPRLRPPCQTSWMTRMEWNQRACMETCSQQAWNERGDEAPSCLPLALHVLFPHPPIPSPSWFWNPGTGGLMDGPCHHACLCLSLSQVSCRWY